MSNMNFSTRKSNEGYGDSRRAPAMAKMGKVARFFLLFLLIPGGAVLLIWGIVKLVKSIRAKRKASALGGAAQPTTSTAGIRMVKPIAEAA